MEAKRNREESLRLGYEVGRRIEAEREYEFERKLRRQQASAAASAGEQGMARLRTIANREYPLADGPLLAKFRQGDLRQYWNQLRILRSQVDSQLRLHRQLSAHNQDFEAIVEMRLHVEWAFARLAVAPWLRRLNPAWTEAIFGSATAALQPIFGRGSAR
jgi:hypothetical protein